MYCIELRSLTGGDYPGYRLVTAWRVVVVVRSGDVPMLSVDQSVELPGAEPLGVLRHPGSGETVLWWRDGFWDAVPWVLQLLTGERVSSGVAHTTTGRSYNYLLPMSWTHDTPPVGG